MFGFTDAFSAMPASRTVVGSGSFDSQNAPVAPFRYRRGRSI